MLCVTVVIGSLVSSPPGGKSCRGFKKLPQVDSLFLFYYTSKIGEIRARSRRLKEPRMVIASPPFPLPLFTLWKQPRSGHCVTGIALPPVDANTSFFIRSLALCWTLEKKPLCPCNALFLRDCTDLLAFMTCHSLLCKACVDSSHNLRHIQSQGARFPPRFWSNFNSTAALGCVGKQSPREAA